MTYQTNRKVILGHVHNMTYNKLLMTLVLGTLLIISISSSISGHWSRLKVRPFSNGVSTSLELYIKNHSKTFYKCILAQFWIISTLM